MSDDVDKIVEDIKQDIIIPVIKRCINQQLITNEIKKELVRHHYYDCNAKIDGGKVHVTVKINETWYYIPQPINSPPDHNANYDRAMGIL